MRFGRSSANSSACCAVSCHTFMNGDPGAPSQERGGHGGLSPPPWAEEGDGAVPGDDRTRMKTRPAAFVADKEHHGPSKGEPESPLVDPVVRVDVHLGGVQGDVEGAHGL